MSEIDLSKVLNLKELNQQIEDSKNKISELKAGLEPLIKLTSEKGADNTYFVKAKRDIQELGVEMKVYKTLVEEIKVTEAQAKSESLSRINSIKEANLKATQQEMSNTAMRKAALDELKIKNQEQLNAIKALNLSETERKAALSQANQSYKEQKNSVKQLYDNIQNLTNAEKEHLMSAMANKAEVKELTKNMQSQATMMNLTASAYERLKAEANLAQQAALNAGAALEFAKRGGAANAAEIDKLNREYNDLAKKSQDVTHSLYQMEQATGKVTARTMGSYPAVFSFSQVLREMPNFAISARVGFMSLSNNLPMLADDFRRLSKEVDVNTGKMLGTSGALKILAKELIGFNAIVILASTLLVMYGDDISNWVAELWKATDAVGALEGAMIDANAQFSNSESGTNKLSEGISKVSLALEGVKDGTIEGNRALALYNSTLSQYLGKANSVEEARTKMTANASKLAKAMGYLNAAESELTNRQKVFAEIAKNRNQITDEFAKKHGAASLKIVTDLEEQGKSQEKIKIISDKIMSGAFMSEDYARKIASENGLTLEQYNLLVSLSEQKKKDVELNIAANNQLARARENFKLANLALPLNEKEGKKGREYKAKTDYEQEYFYSRKIAALKLGMYMLEEQIGKETSSGIENEFERRASAAFKYSMYNRTLIEEERNRELSTLTASTEKRRTELNRKLKYNDDYAKSDKNYQLYKTQLEAALTQLTENEELKRAEINDKYNIKIVEDERTKAKNIISINKDMYDFQKKEIDKRYGEITAINQVAYQKEQANLKSKFKLTRLFGGNSAGEEISSMALSQEQKLNDLMQERAKLQMEMNALQNLSSVSSEEYYAKKAEIAKKDEDIQKTTALNEIELAEKVNEKKEDLMKDLFSKSVEMAKALSDSLFEVEQDRLDKLSKKEEKIFKEKQDNLDDKKKKGLVTEQEYEDEKAKIATQGEAVQEDIERRKEELKRKQFLLGQGMAVAQVTLEYAMTMMAIQKAKAEMTAASWWLGIAAPAAASAAISPLEILATGVYGVSLGLIAAQTIPQFEHGVRNFKGGKAIVNEVRDEVVIEPNREPYIPIGRNVLLDLPKGTSVIPSLGEYANLVGKDNDTIRRKMEFLSYSNNSSNFTDANIVRELITTNRLLRKSKQSPKDYSKLAKIHRNNTRGIA